MNDKLIDLEKDNRFIEEGLKHIEDEYKQENEIDVKTDQIVHHLIQNTKGSSSKIKVNMKVEDDTVNSFILALQSFKAKILTGTVTKIVLTALNEDRYKIANDLQMPYKPATFACDFDADYTYEENIRALVRAFIAKASGRFKVEVLEEDKVATKIIKENKR